MTTRPSKVTILFITANPPGWSQLDLEQERKEFTKALRSNRYGDRFEDKYLFAAQVGDILQALRDHQPTVVHMSQHGDYQGELVFTSADHGEDAPTLSPEGLAEKLQIFQEGAEWPVRLVVLATCNSATAAQLVAQHVDCAIGMGNDVGDEALATRFTPSFYAALADGKSVKNAMASAKNAMMHDGGRFAVKDAEAVQLFNRDGVDPASLKLTELVQPPLSDLHLNYLRGLFGLPWATVHLTDLLQGHTEEVSLLDIYVPLPVTFKVTIKVEENRIVDWGIKREKREEAALGREHLQEAMLSLAEEAELESTARRPKQRGWSELGVDEDGVQLIVDEIQRKILDRKEQGATTDNPESNWFMEAHDAASVQPRFVLLGDPGSGKSSFLRHLALCMAGELRRRAGDVKTPPNASLAALRDWLLDVYTPIYVELRDLVSENFPRLPDSVQDEPRSPTVEDFWSYVRSHALKGFAGFEPDLRELAATGDAILLLDGLDEVPGAADPRRRKQIKDLVAALVGTYPALRIIVTARPHAYRLDQWSLHGFGYTMLEPLSLARLSELALALFGKVRPDQPQEEAKAFIKALEQDEKAGRIEESFYATPMFFTMLAAIWLDRPERRLPAGKAALYRASVDLLLDRYTRRRAPHSSVASNLGVKDPKELRSVLECLACTVHEQSKVGQDTTVFHVKELLGILAEAGYNMPIQDVAAYLEQHAGLLVSPKANHFYFSHRGFQEHLAACELTCEAPEDRRPAVSDERCFPGGLIERVRRQPELWENVARLAAEELFSGKRALDGWQMLSSLCEPYVDPHEAPQAAMLALDIAASLKLFELEIGRRDRRSSDFDLLRQAAERAVVDRTAFSTPEQRNLAGEILGRRPNLDRRDGVGVKNNLPDIAWEFVPDKSLIFGSPAIPSPTLSSRPSWTIPMGSAKTVGGKG